MLAHHLLTHLGIAAVAIVVLPLFGVAFSTALFVGLMGGCVAMAFGVGHGGLQHGSTKTTTSQRTRAHAREE